MQVFYNNTNSSVLIIQPKGNYLVLTNTTVTNCPPGKFGGDCTCTSPAIFGATFCSNGQWSSIPPAKYVNTGDVNITDPVTLSILILTNTSLLSFTGDSNGTLPVVTTLDLLELFGNLQVTLESFPQCNETILFSHQGNFEGRFSSVKLYANWQSGPACGTLNGRILYLSTSVVLADLSCDNNPFLIPIWAFVLLVVAGAGLAISLLIIIILCCCVTDRKATDSIIMQEFKKSAVKLQDESEADENRSEQSRELKKAQRNSKERRSGSTVTSSARRGSSKNSRERYQNLKNEGSDSRMRNKVSNEDFGSDGIRKSRSQGSRSYRSKISGENFENYSSLRSKMKRNSYASYDRRSQTLRSSRKARSGESLRESSRSNTMRNPRGGRDRDEHYLSVPVERKGSRLRDPRKESGSEVDGTPRFERPRFRQSARNGGSMRYNRRDSFTYKKNGRHSEDERNYRGEESLVESYADESREYEEEYGRRERRDLEDGSFREQESVSEVRRYSGREEGELPEESEAFEVKREESEESNHKIHEESRQEESRMEESEYTRQETDYSRQEREYKRKEGGEYDTEYKEEREEDSNERQVTESLDVSVMEVRKKKRRGEEYSIQEETQTEEN